MRIDSGQAKLLTKSNVEDHFRTNPFFPMTWTSPICEKSVGKKLPASYFAAFTNDPTLTQLYGYVGVRTALLNCLPSDDPEVLKQLEASRLTTGQIEAVRQVYIDHKIMHYDREAV